MKAALKIEKKGFGAIIKEQHDMQMICLFEIVI